MLTSTKNPRIILIRKLQMNGRLRKKECLFVVEGVRLLEEALFAGWKPETLIYTEDLNKRGMDVIQAYSSQGVEAIPVASHVMKAASDTQSPQGILALFPIPDISIPNRLEFALILDGLRDPGNMGTIFRSSLAAGVDTILLPPGTVDPYSPKVVRAAMGAHFRLPFLRLSWDEIIQLVISKNLSTYLADSSKGQIYDCIEYKMPLVFIIGGEVSGAGSKALALSPKRVNIPMCNSVESLNAATATAILVFEVSRQKRSKLDITT